MNHSTGGSLRGRKLVAALIEESGFLALRTHPHLHTTAHRMVRDGELAWVAPGFYVAAHHRSNPEVLLAVLRVWAPEAVLIGETAHAVHRGLLPSLPLRVALRPDRKPPSWLRIVRSRIANHLVVIRRGLRCASQVWLAVESAARDAGERIFDLLREAPHVAMELVPTLSAFRGRSGSRSRNQVVRACQRKPYSFAELRLHQLLDAHGIDGWVANHRFRVSGQTYIVDLYLQDALLAVEFDSWEFHNSRDAFERDRAKQLALAAIGVTTIRVTWRMLTETPDALAATLKSAIRAAGHTNQFVA